MFWLLAPCPRELGAAEVTVGPVVTVNTPMPVAALLSGLVTVALRAPVLAAPEIVMLAVSWVALTNVVELTVIPIPENTVLAPLSKPVPVIVMVWPLAPCPRELGLVEVTEGAALTAKTPVPVAVVRSGLVTVTFRAPVVAAPEIVMLTVSWVELEKVVELTVTPVPENTALAPL